MVKGLNAILEQGHIGTVISETEIQSGIDSISLIVDQQATAINSIVDSGMMNSGDSKISRKQSQSKNTLGKSFDFLDGMITNVNTAATRRRRGLRTLPAA